MDNINANAKKLLHRTEMIWAAYEGQLILTMYLHSPIHVAY